MLHKLDYDHGESKMTLNPGKSEVLLIKKKIENQFEIRSGWDWISHEDEVLTFRMILDLKTNSPGKEHICTIIPLCNTKDKVICCDEKITQVASFL